MDILESLASGEYLGSGACGCVLKVYLNYQIFALKLCDVFKSSKRALNELKNEIFIMNYLNKSNVSCTPTIILHGKFEIQKYILMTLIEGRVFNKFNEMDLDQKNSCIQSLGMLHKFNCLHGDIRAANFIVTETNIVFITHFGKSRILDESSFSQLLLDKEMAQLLEVNN